MITDTTTQSVTTASLKCGTRYGGKLHRKHKEILCDLCKDVERAYQKEYRHKKRVPLEERVAPSVRPQCGSPRGSDLHAYHGELACNLCKIAGNKRIRDYDAEHPDKKEIRSKKWHIENPGLSREAGKKWRLANHEKIASKNRKQRAIKLGASTEPYTVEEVLAKWGINCHICEIPVDLLAPRRAGKENWEFGLQIDHVIPISKGGADVLENVKPSHCKCNLQKRASINY